MIKYYILVYSNKRYTIYCVMTKFKEDINDYSNY